MKISLVKLIVMTSFALSNPLFNMNHNNTEQFNPLREYKENIFASYKQEFREITLSCNTTHILYSLIQFYSRISDDSRLTEDEKNILLQFLYVNNVNANA